MKDSNIKNVLSNNKQLDDIISETKSLKDLCHSAKVNVREQMKMLEIDEGDLLRISDPIHLDFIYVTFGVLKVVLERSINGKTE